MKTKKPFNNNGGVNHFSCITVKIFKKHIKKSASFVPLNETHSSKSQERALIHIHVLEF